MGAAGDSPDRHRCQSPRNQNPRHRADRPKSAPPRCWGPVCAGRSHQSFDRPRDRCVGTSRCASATKTPPGCGHAGPQRPANRPPSTGSRGFVPLGPSNRPRKLGPQSAAPEWCRRHYWAGRAQISNGWAHQSGCRCARHRKNCSSTNPARAHRNAMPLRCEMASTDPFRGAGQFAESQGSGFGSGR